VPTELTGDTKKDVILSDPEIRQHTDHGINHAACFVMAAKGISLREISKAWNCSYLKLLRRCSDEDWPGLIRKYGEIFQRKIPIPEQSPDEIAKKLKKIEENRDRTISAATGLMQQIQHIIDQISTKQEQNPDAFMDPETISDLARSVKLLGEISMVAHGDEYAVKGGVGQPRPGSNNLVPMLQINIPAIVAAPRHLKRVRETVEKINEKIEQGLPEEGDGSEQLTLETSDARNPN